MFDFFLKKSIKYKQCNKFIFSSFISKTIAFSVLHTSLICCVIIQYFKDSGVLPLQLSIIIISKRILRLFCDILFGLIFDRFGAKTVFILGRILKLTSYFVLLFFPVFEGFIIAMLLDGASYSSIYGKISSYIYNNLSVRRKLRLFPKAMSMYYFCTEATVATMTFFSGLLLKIYGYNILIYISILTNVFSIILLIKFIPNNNSKIFIKYQAKSIKNIFLTLKNVIKYEPKFLYLIGLYGISSFLAWQFNSISTLIFIDMGVSSANIAFCGAILKTVMCIGALLSMIFFSKGIEISKCTIYLFIVLLFGTITTCCYSKYLFYIFCLLIVSSYTTIEVSIERKLEHYSDKTIRGTAVSLAMTFCSLVSIFSNLIVGFIAQKNDYKTALLFLMLTLTIFVTYLFFKLTRVFKKNN